MSGSVSVFRITTAPGQSVLVKANSRAAATKFIARDFRVEKLALSEVLDAIESKETLIDATDPVAPAATPAE